MVSVSSGLSQFSFQGWPSEAYKARIQAADSLEALRAISFDASDEGCQKSATNPGGMPGVPAYR